MRGVARFGYYSVDIKVFLLTSVLNLRNIRIDIFSCFKEVTNIPTTTIERKKSYFFSLI